MWRLGLQQGLGAQVGFPPYNFKPLKKSVLWGTSQVVQWLSLHARPGFNPWSGNWILRATTKTQLSQIKKIVQKSLIET